MKITLIHPYLLGAMLFTLCNADLHATVAFINSRNDLKVIDASTDIVTDNLFVKGDKKLIFFLNILHLQHGNIFKKPCGYL